MLRLRSHARANTTARALRDAARDAENVRSGSDNGPDTILHAYRRWASTCLMQLCQHIADDEYDRMITSHRYWTLQTIDPATWERGPFQQYVDYELRERAEVMTREAELLEAEWERWNGGGTGIDSQYLPPHSLDAVVLDTNVLLTHHAELASRDWHADLRLEFPAPLGLARPLRVVRELDRKKMANNNDVNRGTRNELRKDAGNALRFLEDAVADPSNRKTIRCQTAGGGVITPELNLLLIADRAPGVPMNDPDAEIVDRALSLQPFARKVHLLSYDAGIVFRARQEGLHAVKLLYSNVDDSAP